MENCSLQDIVDGLPYPAFFVDDDFIISHANASANELFEQPLSGQVFARVLRQPEALTCLKDARETRQLQSCDPVSYTHLTLPTTPYV